MKDNKIAAKMPEILEALSKGQEVYAKEPSFLDWIKIDAINSNGLVRAADDLSGLNSNMIGEWFKPRDIEVQ